MVSDGAGGGVHVTEGGFHVADGLAEHFFRVFAMVDEIVEVGGDEATDALEETHDWLPMFS